MTDSGAILHALSMTAKLMELHEENPFKTKAYTAAAYKLGKLRYNFEGKTRDDIETIEGIGKGISSKIFELATTGTTPELKALLDRTPPGVVQMLDIKGLGPKKVRQLWLELNCESVGELLYACNENRLVTLKGFGEKTQTQVQQSIEFKISNNNKFHYAALERPVNKLVEAIRAADDKLLARVVGQMARKNEVIDGIDILISGPLPAGIQEITDQLPLNPNFLFTNAENFWLQSVLLSSADPHLQQTGLSALASGYYENEERVYRALNMQFVPAELREGLGEVELAKKHKLPELITYEDLRGILHNHTTYSDGVHTLSEMAAYCKSLGFQYLGICDHSRAAAYAQGLSIERVLEQQKEIDLLNSKDSNFRILKGIESDILGDGSLDYPEEVLKTFDFVVASVHSNLKMTEEKATARIIKAIENPYTSILGHPSGRLLLGRSGYPLDYKKIIDACAANHVSIELNAHPYRLDIDWRWIPYCLEKGVLISINPDAHHKEGFHDMYYGVCAARKGMLDKGNCLNALDLNGVLKFFAAKTR